MKRFLSKISAFALLGFLTITAVLLLWPGAIDYFYVKFTSPLQRSMIVGDSRSFQGLQPSQMTHLSKDFEGPVFNYSFTIGQAVYGEVYLESIKRKLDPATKNGIFILQVDPMLFTTRPGDDFENGIFFEEDLPPHNMHFVASKPNYEYLVRNRDFFHFRGMLRQISVTHPDGWLEYRENISSAAQKKDAQNVALKEYQRMMTEFKPTTYRVEKLQETVEFLQKHGKVVLLRMPLSAEFALTEKNFWPDLDAQMDRISKQTGAPYLNYAFRPDLYDGYDGSHLDLKTGKVFSRHLADTIRTLSFQKTTKSIR